MIRYLMVLTWLLSNGWTQSLVFKDVADNQLLNFVHDHGGTGEKYYIETMGSGVCLFDYDNDGDLDAYFLQGASLPGWDKEIILENKLYRNDGKKWKDVTDEAGVGDKNYGIGAQIIKSLKIKNMILVTRSKKKVVGLEGYGIKITKQEIIK